MHKLYDGGCVGEEQNMSDADKTIPSQSDRSEKDVGLSQDITTVNVEVVDVEEALSKNISGEKIARLMML